MSFFISKNNEFVSYDISNLHLDSRLLENFLKKLFNKIVNAFDNSVTFPETVFERCWLL